MAQYPEFAIRPPETIEALFEKVTQGPIWADTKSFAGDMWALSALRFCTDEECSSLSGVPERSLRLLQTSGLIHATKAPRTGGSFKRVWHIPEAVVATGLECLKRATNLDYATIAEMSFQAAVTIRMLFVDYVEMAEDDCREEFDAALVLTQNNALFLQVNDHVKQADPVVRALCVGNLIPVAAPDKDGWKAINPKNIDQRKRFAAAFDTARYHTVVSLKNVFEQFERDARKMRT